MSEEDQIERDKTAPEQPETEPQQDGEAHIYLPGLLSDEFGISRSQANLEIATGRVFIDGEQVQVPNPMTFPKSEVAGKTIEVKGGQFRSFRVKIPASA
jgi:hypothetical protein